MYQAYEAVAELNQLWCSIKMLLIKAMIILPGTALVFVPALIVWLTLDTAFAVRFPPGTAIP